MNCREFLDRLDAGLPADEGEAGIHQKDCAACRKAAERWKAIEGELLAMGREEEPAFLHTRIMAHVNEYGGGRRFSWLHARSWSLAGPIAAVFIIMILGGFGVFNVLKPVQEPVPLDRLSPPGEAIGGPELEEDETASIELPSVVDKEQAPESRADKKAKAEGASAPGRTLESNLREKADDAPRRRAEEVPASEGFGFATADSAAGEAESADEDRSHMREARPRDRGEVALRAAPAAPPAPASAQAPERAKGRRESGALKDSETVYMAVLVDCSLQPEHDGPALLVALPESTAPKPGDSWTVTVEEGCAIHVRDGDGRFLKNLNGKLRERICSLEIAPGNYRLGRGGE